MCRDFVWHDEWKFNEKNEKNKNDRKRQRFWMTTHRLEGFVQMHHILYATDAIWIVYIMACMHSHSLFQTYTHTYTSRSRWEEICSILTLPNWQPSVCWLAKVRSLFVSIIIFTRLSIRLVHWWKPNEANFIGQVIWLFSCRLCDVNYKQVFEEYSPWMVF